MEKPQEKESCMESKSFGLGVLIAIAIILCVAVFQSSEAKDTNGELSSYALVEG